MDFITVLVMLTNLMISNGKPEVGVQYDPQFYERLYNNSLGKAHYSPWACNYRLEPGYKCLSCNRALHCYIGNLALLVQCAGLFPYCRNGYCSRYKTNGCLQDPPDGVSTLSALTHLDKNNTTIINNELTTEAIEVIPEANGFDDKNGTVLHTEQRPEANEVVPQENVTDAVTTMIPDDLVENLPVDSSKTVESTNRMYYSKPPSSSLVKIIKSFLGIIG